MTIPHEIYSSIVEQMRAWRRQGDSVSKILARLWPAKDRLDLMGHLRIAFCAESLPNFALFPHDEQGRLRPEPVDDYFGTIIDEARQRWDNAPPYPDLYRLRDRHAFRAVAAAYQARILVAATDRRAAQYVGQAGYRPCPPALWGVPRTTPPHAGLLAADPGDARLRQLLAYRHPALSYQDYRRELAANGFHILGEESGYLVRDQANQAFYPGYYLQGMYGEEKSQNLWRGPEAEQIRFELNQRMGEDLVQYGPHDLWELLLQSGPAGRPLVPVIIFEPDGNVNVRQNVASLRAYYGYRYLPWEQLYPEEVE
jgi:hypothetical protein